MIITLVKSPLWIVLVYLCLSLLAMGCSERDDPAPACITAEVIGPDTCQPGWYMLKLQESDSHRSNGYIGQLHSGNVTASNLPEAYRQPGLVLRLTLEVDGRPTQVCDEAHIVYPAVRIVRVCAADGGNAS